jgi:hypothetical protein
MIESSAARIAPAPETLAAARQWLAPVRAALGSEFLACYLTGSVLRQGFDPRRSHVNLLVLARTLGIDTLDRLAVALPRESKQPPHVESLFMSEAQMRRSLDAFAIEWKEIQECHLLLEGQDLVTGITVSTEDLRLQCEHELRVKALRLRQRYLAHYAHPARFEDELRGSASGFATLFRTLLRLSGEPVPAETTEVVKRVADRFQLDAAGLLGATVVRMSERRYTGAELLDLHRAFLIEIDRLCEAIDTLRIT